MSERRRSAAALSSRAHAFSVEALIGSNKKRKLRGWEEKELGLSMESLAADGEEPAHCLDLDPDSEASPGSDGEGLAERTSCSFGSPADLAPVPGPHGALAPVPGPPGLAACSEPPAPASMEEIQVELQCADLWKRFHDIGTEMIITKAGRRMFPAMRVKIAGLDPHQQYYIAMDIVPVDNKRYRSAHTPRIHSPESRSVALTEGSDFIGFLVFSPRILGVKSADSCFSALRARSAAGFISPGWSSNVLTPLSGLACTGNQRSRPLVVRRGNAAFTHEA
ncbi:T-box transcription factor TBX15 [Liparis tanakae]|uniref:T-box transcription factor TBX15 n=1 Tax=Liparis tanakae TaxID=230148 RepID=A0A4Z2F3G0_9TELE|nr:T-box transcription factor TBX15 [Liparis tanakae]